MNKSIVVIKTPENCYKCPLNCNNFCYGTNNCTLKYLSSKPNWCPLKSVPEKYENMSDDNSPLYHMCVGWNNCIDEIVGD